MHSILLLNIFLGFTYLHPFHVSVCEIEYDAGNEALEISHRIFFDDLEREISKLYQLQITELIDQESQMSDSIFADYFKRNFSIDTDHQKQPHSYLGYELDLDVVWIYLECENIAPFNSITIKNETLLGLFSDQANIVHVKKANQIRSFKLDGNKVEETIVF